MFFEASCSIKTTHEISGQGRSLFLNLPVPLVQGGESWVIPCFQGGSMVELVCFCLKRSPSVADFGFKIIVNIYCIMKRVWCI